MSSPPSPDRARTAAGTNVRACRRLVHRCRAVRAARRQWCACIWRGGLGVVATLVGQPPTVQQAGRRHALGVPAVGEAHRRIDHHGLSCRDHVDDEREVLDDGQLLAERVGPHPLGAEDERGPVEPVAAEQAHGQVLAAELGGRLHRGADRALDPVAQRVDLGAVLVDDPDTDLDDRGVGVRRVGGADGGQEAGFEQVVAAQEHHQVGGRQVAAPCVVAGGPQVGLVADVADPRVALGGEVLGHGRVRVAVVDDDQAPVGVGLGAHAVHGREQQLGLAPEGHEDLDRRGRHGKERGSQPRDGSTGGWWPDSRVARSSSRRSRATSSASVRVRSSRRPSS